MHTYVRVQQSEGHQRSRYRAVLKRNLTLKSIDYLTEYSRLFFFMPIASTHLHQSLYFVFCVFPAAVLMLRYRRSISLSLIDVPLAWSTTSTRHLIVSCNSIRNPSPLYPPTPPPMLHYIPHSPTHSHYSFCI